MKKLYTSINNEMLTSVESDSIVRRFAPLRPAHAQRYAQSPPLVAGLLRSLARLRNDQVRERRELRRAELAAPAIGERPQGARADGDADQPQYRAAERLAQAANVAGLGFAPRGRPP